jgi:nucleoside-diphosphate-sugar epimerase
MIIDNLERGDTSGLEIDGNNISMRNIDLRNTDECKGMFYDMDIVVHLASKVGGIGVYTSRPYEVFRDMLKIDANVLDEVISSGVERYFYASSAHIYPLELQATPNPLAIKEEQAFPANPELSYGMAKLVGEKNIVYAMGEHQNLRSAVARYIGIYGPGQDYGLDTGSVIPVFSHRAIKHPKTPFSVWGTGEETRSYCFIDDAVECTIRMIEKMESTPLVGPLNVGKQEIISIADIAAAVIEISGKKIEIEFDRTKDTLIWGQWCDCSLAEKTLDGWKAATSFKEGLKVVYKDIRERLNNQDG